MNTDNVILQSLPESVQRPILLGDSAHMVSLRRQVARVAPTEATVLIFGESGTGKEVVARAIHEESDRRREAFVAVNCGAISSSLVGSELFGHEKGSFTGAFRRHHGAFERASAGTLFLDEVAEMPVDMQVLLLRVLEDGQFHRLGSEEPIRSRARVIAATNREPQRAIAEGRLRADLHYRLAVFPIRIKALRERPEDIELLANHFLDQLNRNGAVAKKMSLATVALLIASPWHGNVRELKHYIHRAYILSDGEVIAGLGPQADRSEMNNCITIKVGGTIAEAEELLIKATLKQCCGDKVLAATTLGISLKTLYCRIRNYNAVSAARIESKSSVTGLVDVRQGSMEAT
jgi:two-component system, NtrC family, response regulator AtoC